MRSVFFLSPSYNYRELLKKDIKEVAQEFEAILLKEVLKHGFRPLIKDKSFYQRFYYDMLLENLSSKLAQSGGVGIAKFILENHTEMPEALQDVKATYRAYADYPRDREELIQMVKALIKEEGLPEWIVRIPMVESGFNTRAVSPKGAGGLWQLMPETARSLGLRVDSEVDERFDPVKSTKAALRLIKELYSRLKDWRLVLIAYNWGPGNLERAGREKVLENPSLLPEETRNYLRKVLGAVEWKSSYDDRG